MKSRKMPTMQRRLAKLVLVIALPLIAVIFGVIALLMWRTLRYETILGNVTTASAFNQDFKNNVDLKMYYYTVDSAYSEGLPLKEVEEARAIAERLLETTTEEASIEAIESVRDLCNSLESSMQHIAQTKDYDEKLEQLENNIYILTDLIETYMYNYLYCESVHLSSMQAKMYRQILLTLIFVIIGMFLLTVLLVVYYQRVAKRITDPLTRLADRVDQVSSGDLEPKEHIIARESEIQTLSDGIEEMTGRIKALIDANTVAEQKKRRAELELLQAQINPHFLYNTLDTIIWLIESGEKEKSVEMVNSLSNFFRFSLSRGSDVITLEEEERHVRSYLQIQRTRYRDRMDYEIEIPRELGCYSLPKLTLQPLVENSIYHGIKMKRGSGKISITGREDDKSGVIELTVRDDGAGMTKERLCEIREAFENEGGVGFGLRTVHQRIQLLFGEDYGLSVESEQNEGTQITVRIPKTKLPKENAIHE